MIVKRPYNWTKKISNYKRLPFLYRIWQSCCCSLAAVITTIQLDVSELIRTQKVSTYCICVVNIIHLGPKMKLNSKHCRSIIFSKHLLRINWATLYKLTWLHLWQWNFMKNQCLSMVYQFNLHSQANFVYVVQNQLLFRIPLMLCLKWSSCNLF